MYQLLIPPYNWPITRRQARIRLFKVHGIITQSGPLSAAHLALLQIAEPIEATKPVITDEQDLVRDAAPTVIGGASVFGWTVVDKTAGDLTAAKSALLDRLAEIRLEKEEGGVTLGQNNLRTDLVSQSRLGRAYVRASADPGYVIANFKARKGVFRSLTAVQIIAAADAVEAHVQACFANEDVLTAAVIAAPDFTSLQAIDLQAGWP